MFTKTFCKMVLYIFMYASTTFENAIKYSRVKRD